MRVPYPGMEIKNSRGEKITYDLEMAGPDGQDPTVYVLKGENARSLVVPLAQGVCKETGQSPTSLSIFAERPDGQYDLAVLKQYHINNTTETTLGPAPPDRNARPFAPEEVERYLDVADKKLEIEKLAAVANAATKPDALKDFTPREDRTDGVDRSSFSEEELAALGGEGRPDSAPQSPERENDKTPEPEEPEPER